MSSLSSADFIFAIYATRFVQPEIEIMENKSRKQ